MWFEMRKGAVVLVDRRLQRRGEPRQKDEQLSLYRISVGVTRAQVSVRLAQVYMQAGSEIVPQAHHLGGHPAAVSSGESTSC